MGDLPREQVVVITGASGGVGRATAVAFAARGDRVALLARGTRRLTAVAGEIEAAGGTCMTVPVDVADQGALEAAADRVEATLGDIDVWVNVAFTSVLARFMDISAEEFERVTDVSYHGFVNGTRSALARMLPRDRGTVVQVGSTLAYRGVPLQSAYSGSKHALQGFHESLRTELLHDRSNVRVTMVQMPAGNTPQLTRVLSRVPRKTQLVPQINQPEVAAKAILYAADHPRRREYWVGVSTVGTLVANAVAPGLLDRYLARTGFGPQQSKAPRRPDQPVNLWWPAEREDGQDFGAPVISDSPARARSAQLWASQHHDVLTAVAGLALGARYLLRRLAP